MADMFLRDLDEETKRRIQERAAENGRSQGAVACAVLKAVHAPEPAGEDTIVEYGDEGFSAAGVFTQCSKRNTRHNIGNLVARKTAAAKPGIFAFASLVFFPHHELK